MKALALALSHILALLLGLSLSFLPYRLEIFIMKSSELDPQQKQKPLEKPVQQERENPPEVWVKHPTNPALEVSPTGKLRTKLPLPWLQNI